MSRTRNDKTRKELRQWMAAGRQIERDERTDEQQMTRLMMNGHGGCDEEYRLRRRINDARHTA